MGTRFAGALLLCGMLLGSAAAAESPLQKAAALVQQGRLDEADRQAQLALADPRTRALACSVLGAIRFQQQRLPESARLLRAHLNLAEVYTVQRKPDLARAVFQRVLELDPSNVTARLGLARASIS